MSQTIYRDPFGNIVPLPEELDPDDPYGSARWAERIRHVTSAPGRVIAYVNHGRWQADCVYPHCSNAEALAARQSVFYCTNCRHIAEVVWPRDVEEITIVLAARPVPQTRNWAPAGHRQAVFDGFSEGQTVADLREENMAYGVSA